MQFGEDLPEDQGHVLKNLVRGYPDVFTDMPIGTDVIQHQIKLTDELRYRVLCWRWEW